MYLIQCKFREIYAINLVDSQNISFCLKVFKQTSSPSYMYLGVCRPFRGHGGQNSNNIYLYCVKTASKLPPPSHSFMLE